MNLRDVVHHDVHTGQLTPDLGEDTDMGTVDHVGLEELEIGDISISSFKLADIPDLLQLSLDKGRVWVTVAVDQSENSVALLPPVLTGEPSW